MRGEGWRIGEYHIVIDVITSQNTTKEFQFYHRYILSLEPLNKKLEKTLTTCLY